MNYFNKQLAKELSGIKQKMYIAGTVVEDEMHSIVAIDTGKLDDSIKTDIPEITGNIISVEIGSENIDYAKYVNKSDTEKNYHRNGRIVYSGKGQNFLNRALVNTEDKVLSILKK